MAVSWMLGALLAAACPAQDGVLQAAASAVQAQYLDEAQGARIADALRSWSTQQRYADSCSDPAAFSARLNQDLDMFDGHFHVERVDAAAGQDDWLMAWRADARSNGAGVREVRVLEGNVGYLRLSTFYPLDLARPKLAAAFMLLADTDGLVLDLRQNGGGDDASADLLVRTLLDAKIGTVQQLDQRGRRTPVPLPPASLPAYLKPLVVLIDRRTGSAAEFVAYSLQALGRARIVGTRSGGAAHMFGDPVLLPDGYQISIPDRQPINLRTGGNWEGTGVRPDVAGGDDPLFIARQLLAPAKSSR
ncbi:MULTISPECIES: S41 family peptidase [Stenotrophomonas]|uniref:Peptidase S41 n=1 Tax=Stenotrophomonas maltophilia TaxID=40324 RepID=A0AAD0FQR1_STEMA|nr:S41 family peptidase [Stenotrophomonas maltophilia]AUI09833.1 peptidase S41 [Stenotrophomonas maltophilia]EKU9977239.1 S41 family peptidase [Stenotrophomonas maltophilia]MBA2130766.1 peptidase S41 [Stenotrophomonas maltophilia]MBH1681594.1 S41 family peptidase [Stenotrophomonas maltophilia]MBH1876188.1 S41 family peptidase [Stenotrophomonas maltophilia]